ncbi:hypothetical protein SUGI_0254960 [Cryptomeria japonica]|nr:hypothetical protein SUGI_0254960 [Cryptomeria japonica]
MDPAGREAAHSLESLILSFNHRISQLQEMILSRNVDPNSSAADFAAVDLAVTGMEQQIDAIKLYLKEEAQALPSAQDLIKQSWHQQKRLQHMLNNIPLQMPGSFNPVLDEKAISLSKTNGSDVLSGSTEELKIQKEKKGRGPPPHWYVSGNELDSLSSYMRGRLTLDKINAAIDEMAQFAEANAHLIKEPRNKLGEGLLERALEMRDISTAEPVKGKYFCLETDLKGPVLKLDNTGKAILTVLRHLGRVNEARIGRQRVLILAKPH